MKKRPYRPKRKNKVELFKALFHYWSVKLLDRTYPIVQDNRGHYHMLVEFDEEANTTIVKYHAKRLPIWSFALMVEGVFHEIGHIMQGKMPYETDKQKIYSEWDAEVYGLKMLKRYYAKKDLKEVCDFMKSRLDKKWWQKKYPIHYQAFKDIKEYQ